MTNSVVGIRGRSICYCGFSTRRLQNPWHETRKIATLSSFACGSAIGMIDRVCVAVGTATLRHFLRKMRTPLCTNRHRHLHRSIIPCFNPSSWIDGPGGWSLRQVRLSWALIPPGRPWLAAICNGHKLTHMQNSSERLFDCNPLMSRCNRKPRQIINRNLATSSPPTPTWKSASAEIMIPSSLQLW